MDRLNTRRPARRRPRAPGFSLVELAVVMFIVALLLGGMLFPLSAQRDVRARVETERQLDQLRDQLMGYAVVKDKLPCPATAASNGRETFCSTQTNPCTGAEDYANDNGFCFTYFNGFFPAATLGGNAAGPDGFAYDGWGLDPANRIRYAVSTVENRAIVTRLGLKNLNDITRVAGDIHVCTSGAVVAAVDPLCTNNANALTRDALAVVFSLGPNAAAGGGVSVDEAPNLDDNRVFVRAQPSPTFDDLLVWISPYGFTNRMVAAGRLP